MDGVDPKVGGSNIGDVAVLLEVRRRGDGEHKETKGTITAVGADGDGIGIDGLMQLMELQPAQFGVLLQRRQGVH
jgi:hypothetical protein